MTQHRCKVSVKGVEFFTFIKIRAQHFIYLFQRRKSLHNQRIIGLYVDKLFFFIIFIKNVSYNLFQNIFHSNKT